MSKGFVLRIVSDKHEFELLSTIPLDNILYKSEFVKDMGELTYTVNWISIPDRLTLVIKKEFLQEVLFKAGRLYEKYILKEKAIEIVKAIEKLEL